MNPEQNPQSTAAHTESPVQGELVLKRHPFGLFALYTQAFIGFVVAFGLIWFVIPSLLDGEAQQQANHLLSIFGIIAIAVTALFLLVATHVYRKNQWVITDDSIEQLHQTGMFRRQISELSMANIEDVSAEQNGMLATAFGFGTLRVKTAGEHSNFHFQYCPKPDHYAQIILQTREHYIENEPESAKRANDLLSLPHN